MRDDEDRQKFPDYDSAPWIEDDFDDFDDYNDEESVDEAIQNCGMRRDGQCGKAGSEECDFECPVMADIIRAEILREKQRRGDKGTQLDTRTMRAVARNRPASTRFHNSPRESIARSSRP
jgi:hypothetical protein